MELYLEGITEVKNYQYSGNLEITSLKMSNEVKKIGLQGFSNCSNLKVVEIGEGVEFIDTCAFKNVPAAFFIPKSIKKVEYEAFSKDSVVFFECGEKDFRGYHQVVEEADYPDSYYRGPSMGVDIREEFYYEKGCTLYFNKTKEEFYDYLKHNC